MLDAILWMRTTPLPLIFVTCGLACMILAIASELPPAAGEERLLRPRKGVPITGIVLLLLGVPLAIQWPEGPSLLQTILAYLP